MLNPIPRIDTNSLNVVGTDASGLQCGLKINVDPNNANQHLAMYHLFTSMDRTSPTTLLLETDTVIRVDKSLTIGTATQDIKVGGLFIGKNGYACRAGADGLISAHSFSIDWVNDNTPNLWIDNVNLGKIWAADHPEIIQESVLSCWAVRTLGDLGSHFSADVQVDGKLTAAKLVVGGNSIPANPLAGISIGDAPLTNKYTADTHIYSSPSQTSMVMDWRYPVNIKNTRTVSGVKQKLNINFEDETTLNLGTNSNITLGTNSNIDFGLDLSDTTTVRAGIKAGIRTAYSRTITASSSVMALRTKEPHHINFAWEEYSGRPWLVFYIDGQRQGVIPFTPGDPYP